jgi:predicted phosphodiesterase
VIGPQKFYLVHAAPTDPLFGYRPQDSELWEKEIQSINADVLFVGHTHTPFIRQVGGCTIVNPGSLGQPKTGRPLACYATWEDGEISLKEYNYPLKRTIRQLRQMPLSKQDIEQLIAVLKTGGLSVPAGYSPASVGV